MTEKKTGASLARHRSKQDIATPPEFLDAIARRFGPPAWDLAANSSNSVCGDGRFFGPGSQHAEDSLVVPWARGGSARNGVLFCNPPYGNISPWAAKCATYSDRRGWILLLVPASVGATWYADHVNGKALVLPLRQRIVFVGQSDPYPRDLLLAAYGFGVNGFQPWSWKDCTSARITAA